MSGLLYVRRLAHDAEAMASRGERPVLVTRIDLCALMAVLRFVGTLRGALAWQRRLDGLSAELESF